jgi:hypothetical protein
MRRLAGGLVVATLAVAAAGCRTGVTAGAAYDTAVPFGHPVSFAWDEPDALPIGDSRLDANPFFLARVHGAVERAFSARGIRYDPVKPTLLVHHHATVRDRVEVYAVDRTSGYSDSSYGPGTQVYEYEEGTFLIDVADAATKQIVWRGWATADLADALDRPKELDRLVDLSIEKMFAKFPIAVGTPMVPEPPLIVPLPPVIEPPHEDELPWPDVANSEEMPRNDNPPQG